MSDALTLGRFDNHTNLNIRKLTIDSHKKQYPENVAQSSNLLIYMRKNWDKFEGKIKLKTEELFKFLNSLVSINIKIDRNQWDWPADYSDEDKKRIKAFARTSSDAIYVSLSYFIPSISSSFSLAETKTSCHKQQAISLLWSGPARFLLCLSLFLLQPTVHRFVNSNNKDL